MSVNEQISTQKLRESRQRLIAGLLQADESVTVRHLTEFFGVSDMTIRRDLADMEAAGLLHRVHGGAVTMVVRTPFRERRVEFKDAKMRIAIAAAGLVEDGDSLMLDIGTTTSYIATELRRRKDLFVVTNSVNAAMELSGEKDNSGTSNGVLLVGGLIHGQTEFSLVGAHAIEEIRRFHVNKLILGAGGITLKRGLVYYDDEEVQVRRAMLESAQIVIVAADHSKFGLDQLVQLSPLDRVDVLVTDIVPPSEYLECLQEHDVRLVVAGANAPEA